MRKYILFTLTFLFIFPFCDNNKPSQYIAKVGDNYLTKKELMSKIPDDRTFLELDKTYLKSIVSTWIKKEILFNKAKELNFDKDSNIKRKTDDYFRELVINKFVEYHFKNEISISRDRLMDYYNSNKNKYIRENNTVKVKQYFTEEVEDSREIRRVLYSNNDNRINEINNNYTNSVDYIEEGNCMEEINNALFNSNPKKIYGPIVTDYGYHVIEVIDRYPEGTQKSFTEVRDKIYNKIAHKNRLEGYVRFVDSLKSNTEWNFSEENLNNIIEEIK